VAPNDLTTWVAGADVDVIALQRSSLNHWFCTPNKLWESLTAGVPVVISDFPTMRRVVIGSPGGDLGATCDPADPEAIAEAIRSILSMNGIDRAAQRQRCQEAAHTRWNWETESQVLLDAYSRIRSTD
jgi:glycosyltransferase involved in cell wall biosynthesis